MVEEIPLPVEQRLRRLARDSHQSLNKTALELLSRAVGVGSETKKSRKHRDVESVMRPWTDEEYREFQRNTKVFEQIDEEMWRN